MTPANQKLLQEVQQFVKNIFATRVSPAFLFHDINHTRDVVKACQEFMTHYTPSEDEQLALLIAAWMHDIGYSSGTPNKHEEYSQKLATAFLNDRKSEQHIIDMVNGCIMATKMPQTPTNLIEQIICDADLAHLGSNEFEEKNKLLRQEINELQDTEVGKKEWRQINVEFLQRQRYFTDYAKQKLEPVKKKNLEKLLDKLGKKEKQLVEESVAAPSNVINLNPEKVDPLHAVPATQPTGEMEKKEKDDKDKKDKDKDKDKNDKEKKEKEKLEKDKQNRTDRSVVAMFRIMSENHVNLSQMADSKANIMISVNTIVISIMVSVLLGKLQFYPEYIIPTILLVVPCLGAVIFAILATRPNITRGTFSKEDIQNREVNLLFFGNFYKMELPEYDWAMKQLMQDKEYLYGSMIKDIYFLGVVLARKYKLIRYSYNIFMFGLIVAIIGFALAFLLAEKQS
ncbi:MAG TPA: Pycsar system effector family protein [Flavitalea sp.]|nr:Pycsar system effector family protein [Flavitalea sp.]